MERIIVARHAESELSVRGILNGDPAVRCGLTPRGRGQARDLGRSLRGEAIELAVVTDFERCRETARIALAGRALPWLELPALGDMRNGIFEGGPIAAYARWGRLATAAEPAPGGGESRVDAARRIAAGIRTVLARPEANALLVSHQLPIGFVLAAASGRPPSPRVEAVAHARPAVLDAEAVERAAGTLETWAHDPGW